MTDDDENRYCSFCNKSQTDIHVLISAGSNNVFICDECVSLCSDLLKENKVSTKKKQNSVETYSEEFIPNPDTIRNYLDTHVIGQDTAKEIVSVAVSNHYKRLYHKENSNEDIEIDKSNILLLGPTGVGKTLIAQSLARFLDVPLAISDATSITEAGYSGDDIETIITRLMQVSNYDKEKSERGIVFIDEIDKKAKKTEGTHTAKDVSGEGVQQALLKLIEGDKVRVPPQGGRKQPNQEMIDVDTSNILFIVGGSFTGISEIINKRINTNKGIGFMASVDEQESKSSSYVMKYLEPDDLINFGMIPEFIGRIPVYASLDELSKEQLKSVLTEPKNAIIKQFKKLFEYDGVMLEFTDEALDKVAEKASEKGTGARGLRTIIETHLVQTQYNLARLRGEGLTKVVINKNTIENKTEPEMIYE